jgi:hypothetical protein
MCYLADRILGLQHRFRPRNQGNDIREKRWNPRRTRDKRRQCGLARQFVPARESSGWVMVGREPDIELCGARRKGCCCLPLERGERCHGLLVRRNPIRMFQGRSERNGFRLGALIITSTISGEWTRDAEGPPLLRRWSVGASADPLVGLMINVRRGTRRCLGSRLIRCEVVRQGCDCN